jgi:serine protease Do
MAGIEFPGEHTKIMKVRNPLRRAASLTTGAVGLLAAMAVHAQPAPPAPPERSHEVRVLTMGVSGSYLGIGVKEILAARAKELKLKEESGVEVTRVDPGSPAERAGLKAGDAVLEYQGNRVEGAEQFVRFVRETPAGRQVKMKVVRNGANQTVAATIGSRPGSRFSMSVPDRQRVEQELARVRENLQNMPKIRLMDIPHAVMGWRSGMLGIDGESVEDQLAEYFGVKEGVLVRSVAKDMPAAKAGIKAGDVIVRVDDKAVRSPREITAAIRSAKSGSAQRVTLVRQKSELTVDVQFPEEEPPSPAPGGKAVSSPRDFDF